MTALTYVQPHNPDADLGAAIDEITGIIQDSITSQPRSLQKTIGPSELGTDCDHCLAAKLMGWEQQERGIPWAPTVGTAVHALFEQFFTQHEQQQNQLLKRFLTEQKVKVGVVDGKDIWGSTDLLDTVTGLTVDWKLVGKNSLTKYRHGPSQQYRVQAHLYAKGWNDMGIPVRNVSICFLPRTTNNMRDGFWWTEAYDPQVAQSALDRANQLAEVLHQVEHAEGVEARDRIITSLPRAEFCFDCSKYPDWTATQK